MATALAADQRKLLTVQDADLRAQQAAHRRVALPVLAQLEELSARALDLDNERIARATEVTDLRREVAKAEDDVQSVRTRADRDNARLNAGQGAPKDLQALQSELEVLTARQAALEDIEIEVMQRLEDAENEHAAAVKQAEALAVQVAALEVERDAAFAEIDRELAAIAEERIKAVDGIDSALLALYEKLRASGGGIGAAELKRGACQGCHMNLNRVELGKIEAAPSDQIVRCEECGRILVRGAAA